MSTAAVAKVQNEYMKRRFSTQYSLYNYEVEKLLFLNQFMYPLLMLYFIAAAVYLGIIFIGPNRDKNSYIFKVCALIILILFPFLITPAEYIMLRGVLFLLRNFTGNVLEDDDYNYYS